MVDVSEQTNQQTFRLTSWAGEPNYECCLCPFATVTPPYAEKGIVEHVNSVHGVAAIDERGDAPPQDRIEDTQTSPVPGATKPATQEPPATQDTPPTSPGAPDKTEDTTA